MLRDITDESFDESSLAETVQVESIRGEIIERLRTDPEFFLEFFLGESLSLKVPRAHCEIWQLLTGTSVQRVLLAIPRGHAKTTLAKLSVVWHFLFTNHRFCLYVSNTNGIALNAVKDIEGYLRCANYVAVFGEIEIIKRSETDSLWQLNIIMPNGKPKHCIMRALGAQQQVRGLNLTNQRPDLTVIDDLEDLENTETEKQQAKLDRWVFGSFLKALDKRRNKIIWLGNMLKKTSLLSRLSVKPTWNPVVFGAIVKDSETGQLVPLWPDLWSMDELIKDYQEYRSLGLTETWLCEMMNMPGHSDNGFTAEYLHYRPVPSPDNVRAAWITLDPAFGEEAHNDDSAIVVHVIPEEGCAMVAEYRVFKVNEAELLESMLELALKWNAWVWGIESVAAQRVLITLFKVLLAARGYTERVTMLPLMSGRGDPKISRIRAWASLMNKQEYAIPDYDIDITTQLLAYDVTKMDNKDDLIDSCAYGPVVQELYLPLLLASFAQVETQQGQAKFGRRLCSV